MFRKREIVRVQSLDKIKRIMPVAIDTNGSHTATNLNYMLWRRGLGKMRDIHVAT